MTISSLLALFGVPYFFGDLKLNSHLKAHLEEILINVFIYFILFAIRNAAIIILTALL